MIEKGTPGFSVGGQIRKMGIRFERHGGAFLCRLPYPGLQPHRRRSEEDADVILRLPGPWSQPMRSECRGRRSTLPGRGLAKSASFPITTRRLPNAPRPWTGCSPSRRIGRRHGFRSCGQKSIEQNEGPGKINSSVAKAMGGGLARRATQACIEVLGACGLEPTTLWKNGFATPASSTSTKEQARSSALSSPASCLVIRREN